MTITCNVITYNFENIVNKIIISFNDFVMMEKKSIPNLLKIIVNNKWIITKTIEKVRR